MPQSPELDDDDLPEPVSPAPTKKVKPAAKKAAAAKKRKPAAKKTRSRRDLAPRQDDPGVDDEVDSLGDEEGDTDASIPRTRPDRQSAELAAALKAKLTGEPVFPFPPELKEEHRPYWVEVVNCKPHDYFNNGDIHLLKLYCRVAADIDRLDQEIAEEGSVIANNRNNPIVNPRIIVRSIAETRLLALSTKLRLQPASRYDSENDRQQSEKKKKADAAVRSIGESGDDEDGDDLLAGGGGGGSHPMQ